jgi:hypothetical protein
LLPLPLPLSRQLLLPLPVPRQLLLPLPVPRQLLLPLLLLASSEFSLYRSAAGHRESTKVRGVHPMPQAQVSPRLAPEWINERQQFAACHGMHRNQWNSKEFVVIAQEIALQDKLWYASKFKAHIAVVRCPNSVCMPARMPW